MALSALPISTTKALASSAMAAENSMNPSVQNVKEKAELVLLDLVKVLQNTLTTNLHALLAKENAGSHAPSKPNFAKLAKEKEELVPLDPAIFTAFTTNLLVINAKENVTY